MAGAQLRTILHNVAAISAFIMTISFQIRGETKRFPHSRWTMTQMLCRIFQSGKRNNLASGEGAFQPFSN
jgi:hypothetical protein